MRSAIAYAEPRYYPPPRPIVAPPLNILLVEDNTADAALTQMALDGLRIPYRLKQLRNGLDVIPYLTQPNAVLPDLLLLDLGLPGEDGFEILAEMTAEKETLRHIPIAILTGYEHFEYVEKSYELSIAGYLTKPVSADKLSSVVTRAQTARDEGKELRQTRLRSSSYAENLATPSASQGTAASPEVMIANAIRDESGNSFADK